MFASISIPKQEPVFREDVIRELLTLRLDSDMKLRFADARNRTHATNKLWGEITDVINGKLGLQVTVKEIRVRFELTAARSWRSLPYA